MSRRTLSPQEDPPIRVHFTHAHPRLTPIGERHALLKRARKQNTARRDQSNEAPTQDEKDSCWRHMLELVPSDPPARRQGGDGAPRRWAERLANLGWMPRWFD